MWFVTIAVSEALGNVMPIDHTPRPPYAARPHDGWTAARQAHFLGCLTRHGSVTLACAAVGKVAPAPIACAAALMPPPSQLCRTRV